MTTSYIKSAKFSRTSDSGEKLYTARIERTIYDGNGKSLPVIDTTYDGKPTVEYGLTKEQAIKYLNSFPVESDVVFN